MHDRNTSSHSLRNGGARFYSSTNAPEGATQAQGGWRTTETMRAIYTSLKPSEVRQAIHKAANLGGTEYCLESLSAKFVEFESMGIASDVKLAHDYITMVNDAIDVIPWQSLANLKVGHKMKALTRHKNIHVQHKAAFIVGRVLVLQIIELKIEGTI